MRVIPVILCFFLSVKAKSQEKGFCYASPKQVTSFTNFRTAGLADNYFYWDAGQTLYIKFLNGSDKLQQQVQSIAREWEKYANIKFAFRNEGESHIRIHFNSNYLHSSIGVAANVYPSDMANVEIDTTGFSDKKSMKGIILHMFGHILGLEHENIVPPTGRKWNMHQIDPERKCDETKIMIDYIEPYSVTRSNGLIADRSSIMFQGFPANWTNEKYQKMNVGLSPEDTLLITQIYPSKRKEWLAMQSFSVTKYQQTRISLNEFGFCFYPQFELKTNEGSLLQFSILLYDAEGNVVYNDRGRYVLDEHVAATKAILVSSGKTYMVNDSSNEFGLFLPFSEIPYTYKGQQLMAVFRVYIPDNAKEKASPDYNSRPFFISVPK